MDTKLIIHCVGLEGLTITVSGADHSVPITTDVLRVTTLRGSVEYAILQLPVTFNMVDLNGNLTISDNSGKALYRWRSHAILQSSTPELGRRGSQSTENPKRNRQTPSLSAPPSYRTAETPLNSRSGRALSELEDRQNASSAAGAMAEDANESRGLRSGTRRKVTRKEPNLLRSGSNIIEDQSASSSPVRRPKRTKWKTKGKVQISEESIPESSGSDIVLARKRKRNSNLRSKVSTASDSSSDSLKSSIVAPKKQRFERRDRMRLESLSDRDLETPATNMTSNRRVFLRNLLDRLSKEHKEDCEPFAKPVDAVAEKLPTYHEEIERAMDLRTLNGNLDKGLYTSVEDFEKDFNLMIENSIRFNGLMHEVSQSGLRLSNAFNVSMASLPGRK